MPFSYQSDLLDPLGRTISISFRKLFLPPRSFFTAAIGGRTGLKNKFAVAERGQRSVSVAVTPEDMGDRNPESLVEEQPVETTLYSLSDHAPILRNAAMESVT